MNRGGERHQVGMPAYNMLKSSQKYAPDAPAGAYQKTFSTIHMMIDGW